MNWKYNNTVDEVETDYSSDVFQELLQASKHVSSGSGGNSIRVVENTIYFYGDILESNPSS